MSVAHLGWNAHFEKHFRPYEQQALAAARVARAAGGFYTLLDAEGEKTAALSGQLRHGASPDSLPAVGDWVIIDPRAEDGLRVQAVLPRQTALVRAAGGNRKRRAETPGAPQVLAANVDTALIVSGLDRDYNPRRIERYLTLVYDSGAAPVIILNKVDLCPAAQARRAEIEEIAFGTPVLATNARDGEGLHDLSPYLVPGRTLVLLGSSGAGKSTLLNRLSGTDHQRTGALSDAVNKGTHTTTHRELFSLPGGALIIDTPGLRELHLWGESEEGLTSTFPDIAALAQQCRFRDCRHDEEPGCAIRQAVRDESLDPARLESYLKQRSQLAHAALRQDTSAQTVQKQKWKSIHRDMKRRRRDHDE